MLDIYILGIYPSFFNFIATDTYNSSTSRIALFQVQFTHLILFHYNHANPWHKLSF